jgi:hypothetical protein
MNNFIKVININKAMVEKFYVCIIDRINSSKVERIKLQLLLEVLA